MLVIFVSELAMTEKLDTPVPRMTRRLQKPPGVLITRDTQGKPRSASDAGSTHRIELAAKLTQPNRLGYSGLCFAELGGQSR